MNIDNEQQKKEQKLKEEIGKEREKYEKPTDLPFHFARERLNWFLDNAKKSGMMLYINGDKDGNVKLKGGETTKALIPKLNEIEKENISEKEKLQKLEQAVLDIYWQVRKDQGMFDSKLGNALENFINSPRGLNLPLKYGNDCPVPHIIKDTKKPNIIEDILIDENKVKSSDQLLEIMTTSESDDDVFAKRYKNLMTQLDPENLKTNRRPMITNLIKELEKIRNNNLYEFSKEEKLKEMKEKIIASYHLVKKAAANDRFFGNSNLANALEKFLKNEFTMNKDDFKPKQFELTFNEEKEPKKSIFPWRFK